MDTRIEELADIIIDRCRDYRKEPGYDDKYETYLTLRRLAEDMLIQVEGYRQRHKEDE
jgi:hypothetical protein